MFETPFDISGDLPVRFPESPAAEAAGDDRAHLVAVADALTAWEAARDAERAAMAELVAAVDIAREDHAEPLQCIADVLGRTRQYVQKLLRTAATQRAHEAYEAARYSPEASRRSLGRTGGYTRPQCPGCRAFIKHEGAQCSACGFMGGAGYLSVPAKTSHLERWR